MPSVKPFRAVVYNSKYFKDVTKVICPPYDIIPLKMQNDLYRQDGHNFVRLEFGKIKSGDSAKSNRYTRAKRYLDLWLKDGYLVRDDKEALYIYSQSYKKDGKIIDQTGFIGLMGLDMGKRNKVLPHENTLSAPKSDRLSLMREVRSNLSPIFALYDDSSHKIFNILKKRSSRSKPFVDINIGEVRHRLWRLSDPEDIIRIEKSMGSKDIFIADGHHRYETAKNYSEEAAKSPLSAGLKRSAGSIMVYFVESNEKMLTILPAHRLVKDAGPLKERDIKDKLSAAFLLEKATNLEGMMRRMRALRNEHAFGMYLGRGVFYILKLENTAISDRAMKDKPAPWKRLDVSILHQFIFQRALGIRDDDDNIDFFKDAGDTVRGVDRGDFELAFFLNPTKVAEVKRIAKLGERMPRKATYFYPKQLSGLVVNKHG